MAKLSVQLGSLAIFRLLKGGKCEHQHGVWVIFGLVIAACQRNTYSFGCESCKGSSSLGFAFMFFNTDIDSQVLFVLSMFSLLASLSKVKRILAKHIL